MTWDGKERRAENISFNEKVMERFNDLDVQTGRIAQTMEMNHKSFRGFEQDHKEFLKQNFETIYGKEGLIIQIQKIKIRMAYWAGGGAAGGVIIGVFVDYLLK